MERGRGGGREGGEGKEKRRGSGLHGRYKKKGERGRCGERRRERGWGGIEEKREVGWENKKREGSGWGKKKGVRAERNC